MIWEPLLVNEKPHSTVYSYARHPEIVDPVPEARRGRGRGGGGGGGGGGGRGGGGEACDSCQCSHMSNTPMHDVHMLKVLVWTQ